MPGARLSPCDARPGRVTRSTVAWSLLVVFLLQPVLAYLATPLVTHDKDGQQVVICTLEGEKIVDLALPGPVEDHGADHCPALQLLQLVGSVQLPTPPAIPEALLYAVDAVDQTVTARSSSTGFSAYSTRAPPVV